MLLSPRGNLQITMCMQFINYIKVSYLLQDEQMREEMALNFLLLIEIRLSIFCILGLSCINFRCVVIYKTIIKTCSLFQASQPTQASFSELLKTHIGKFHKSRTSKTLQEHWTLMKQYHLLPDQSVCIVTSYSLEMDTHCPALESRK